MIGNRALRLSGKAALYASVAAAVFSWTGRAFAQQATPGQGATIETVVVTASRRSEAVQNVAGQVTALSGNDLEKMHANSFADFANSVPGLSYQSGGPTNNLIAIRGVTTGGTQLGSAVSLYVDDVPVGASTQFGLGFQSLNINVFDLDRVEVLNGPQGTLYGANALGGTIKYITAEPDLNAFDARGEAEGSDTAHSNYNDDLRVMGNMPVLDGQVAIRVDGAQEFDSGYAQDPTHDRTNVGSGRSLGGRVSLLAQITPNIEVRLSAFSQDVRGSGADVSFRDFVTHAPIAGPYDQSYPLQQPSNNSLQLYSGVVNWNLNWANLTSITGYQWNQGQYESDVSTLYDFLFTFFGLPTTDPFGLPVNTNTGKFTQEVRLASPDNKTFEWVAGGYFTREITTESVDLVDAANPGGLFLGELPFFGFLPSTYRELAMFADGTYYFTDNLDLTFGMRYSNQHQTYQSYISSLFLPAGLHYFAAGSDQSVETYLINPRYHITDDAMIYARVSSGFRPGGPNFVLPGSTKVPPSFQADNLWNYEIGEKSTLLDGRATLNADIYDIEWNAIQTTENVDGINQLVNAGDARIEGVEASFDYRVLPDLMLGGSGGYTDAFLTTPSPIIGITQKGVRLPLSPKYNFALTGQYSFDLGNGYSGALSVSDVYVGERTAGYAGAALFVGNPEYKLASYNTVNLDLALFLASNVELDAFVKNVFDVRGEVSANTITDQYVAPPFAPYAPVPVTLSLPRTVGLVIKVGLDK